MSSFRAARYSVFGESIILSFSYQVSLFEVFRVSSDKAFPPFSYIVLWTAMVIAASAKRWPDLVLSGVCAQAILADLSSQTS